MAQSEILGLLTDYFSLENPTADDTNTVYIYASLLILMSALLILINLVFYAGRKFGGMIRILLTNAIYFKVILYIITVIIFCLSGISIKSVDIDSCNYGPRDQYSFK